MTKRDLIVFLDMDGVLADFEGAVADKSTIPDPPEMFQKDFFLNLKPTEGAVEFVEWILKKDDVQTYIATKPLHSNLWSTIEKYQWVEKHMPGLLKRMFLTCDKALLRGDLLVDDFAERWRPVFMGEFFHFDKNNTADSFSALKGYIENMIEEHKKPKRPKIGYEPTSKYAPGEFIQVRSPYGARIEYVMEIESVCFHIDKQGVVKVEYRPTDEGDYVLEENVVGRLVLERDKP